MKTLFEKIDEITLNERPHMMKVYGEQLEALDDAFDALKRIKDIKDPLLRKKINTMRVQIKQLQGELIKL